MKKLFAFILLGMMPLSMIHADDKVPVPLTPTPDKTEHPGQRMPANYSYLPTVYYSSDAGELLFIGNVPLLCSVEVCDENGDVVLSDVLVIVPGHNISMAVDTLPARVYTLVLTIGDSNFEGTFEI